MSADCPDALIECLNSSGIVVAEFWTGRCGLLFCDLCESDKNVYMNLCKNRSSGEAILYRIGGIAEWDYWSIPFPLLPKDNDTDIKGKLI